MAARPPIAREQQGAVLPKNCTTSEAGSFVSPRAAPLNRERLPRMAPRSLPHVDLAVGLGGGPTRQVMG